MHLYTSVSLFFIFFVFPVTPVFASTNQELVDALDLPSENVIFYNIAAGTGDCSQFVNWNIHWKEVAAPTSIKCNSILISNGLASEIGLSHTDWSNNSMT